MLEIVKNLKFDQKVTICKENEIEIYIVRPSVVSKKFKNYDINKNFQIFLKEGYVEFRPNHLRVMIDLSLRSKSREDLRDKLLIIFDNIFYKRDPEKELIEIENEDFKFKLNPLKITAILSQLFLIEQEYAYYKDSNYEPPTLFYQGWIREFIQTPDKIDNLCMSVCSRRPPATKYTSQDNKLHKKYNKDRKKLWYKNN